MYLALNAGKTSLLNRAQWAQLAEAYSTTFTLAAGSPRLMSSAVAPPAGPLLQPASARPAASPTATGRRLMNMRSDLPEVLHQGLKRHSRQAAHFWGHPSRCA